MKLWDACAVGASFGVWCCRTLAGAGVDGELIGGIVEPRWCGAGLDGFVSLESDLLSTLPTRFQYVQISSWFPATYWPRMQKVGPLSQ
jgi:hypothetical protein